MRRFFSVLAQGQQQPPKRHTLPRMGSLNLDATGQSLPPEDFVEAKDVRKQKPNEWETRTGYRAFTFEAENLRTPVCYAEYRLDNVFIDVAFYLEAGTLYALAVNAATIKNPLPVGQTQTAGAETYTAVCAGGSSAPIVCALQYNTYLVVSVITDLAHPNDIGLYALSPTSSAFTAWSVTPLGKTVCPTPSQITYEPTVTGDILLYEPQNVHVPVVTSTSGLGAAGDAWLLSVTTDPGGKRPRILSPLKANATYRLAENYSPDALQRFALKKWEPNAKDPAPPFFVDADHARTNGWGYRCRVNFEVTDVRGSTFTYQTESSVDFWVANKNYALPLLFDFGSRDSIPQVFIPHVNTTLSTVGTAFVTYPEVIEDFDIRAFPDTAAMTQFRGEVLKYLGIGEPVDVIGGKADNNNVVNLHPELFAFIYLLGYVGYRYVSKINPTSQGRGAAGIDPLGSIPYAASLYANELKQAPCVKFSWTDFSALPAGAVSIDFFRTAHSEANDDENATKNPEFKPRRFGYVGTLQKDGTWSDEVPDKDIDFGTTPVESSGFLQGQIAGEVLAIYQRELVLENTRTKYQIASPTALLQAIPFDVDVGTTPGFTADDLYSEPDGQRKTRWYYSYINRDGLESAATAITLSPASVLGFGHPSAFFPLHVAFVFPRGYEEEIATMKLYRSQWNGSSRNVFLEATVQWDKPFYIATDPSTSGLTPATLPVAGVKTLHEPGAVFYSETNDMNFWPQENTEDHHGQDPITASHDVLGRLHTWSDKGIYSTIFDRVHAEPIFMGETAVGCIGRHLAKKIGKTVVFLSAQGMMFLEGSGVEALVRPEGSIQSEILKYLREQIPNKQPLANARRASMGWLGQKNELWLTFPASTDLGGSLTGRTFVYKFVRGPMHMQTECYEFTHTISQSGLAPQPPVIYLSHADGKLFSVHQISSLIPETPFGFQLQDNDVDSIYWPLKACLTYRHPLDDQTVAKILDALWWNAEARCKLSVVTGTVRSDGITSDTHGIINENAQVEDIIVLSKGYEQEFKMRVRGDAAQTTGYPPAIRFISEPALTGEHMFRLKTLTILYDHLHNRR